MLFLGVITAGSAVCQRSTALARVFESGLLTILVHAVTIYIDDAAISTPLNCLQQTQMDHWLLFQTGLD